MKQMSPENDVKVQVRVHIGNNTTNGSEDKAESQGQEKLHQKKQMSPEKDLQVEGSVQTENNTTNRPEDKAESQGQEITGTMGHEDIGNLLKEKKDGLPLIQQNLLTSVRGKLDTFLKRKDYNVLVYLYVGAMLFTIKYGEGKRRLLISLDEWKEKVDYVWMSRKMKSDDNGHTVINNLLLEEGSKFQNYEKQLTHLRGKLESYLKKRNYNVYVTMYVGTENRQHTYRTGVNELVISLNEHENIFDISWQKLSFTQRAKDKLRLGLEYGRRALPHLLDAIPAVGSFFSCLFRTAQ